MKTILLAVLAAATSVAAVSHREAANVLTP